jgi:hypothetical protein
MVFAYRIFGLLAQKQEVAKTEEEGSHFEDKMKKGGRS